MSKEFILTFFSLSLGRYYNDDKGECLPCLKCCGDDQDVVENECKGKLGAGSNMICSFDSSINRCDKATKSPHKLTAITKQVAATHNNYTSPSQGLKSVPSLPPGHYSKQSSPISKTGSGLLDSSQYFCGDNGAISSFGLCLWLLLVLLIQEKTSKHFLLVLWWRWKGKFSHWSAILIG